MVERDDRASIAGFFWEDVASTDAEIRLTGEAAWHAQVKRLRPGAQVRLTDGRGTIALGDAVAVSAEELVVSVSRRIVVPRPTPLFVIPPVADRDRMLLAAEKSVELQATAWQPAYFSRSRSVSPRGEGEKFRDRVRARMISALEQSGAAWLPEARPETELEAALGATGMPLRLLLDAGGSPIGDLDLCGPVAIAIGPEGGLETTEIELVRSHGWTVVSIAAATLRFETAITAAIAIIRAQQLTRGSD